MSEVRVSSWRNVGCVFLLSLAVGSTARSEPGIIGVRIGAKDGWLTLESVPENTPAGRAGLKAGDRIARIDGQSMQNVALGEALPQLAGQAGEKVTLTILRTSGDKTEEFDVTLVRAPVSTGMARGQPSQGPGPYTPTRDAQPVQWHGSRIVSRVLPYPDFVSLFIRLPVAHAAATGRGVAVAMVHRAPGRSLASKLLEIAPQAQPRDYAIDPNQADLQGLPAKLKEAGARVILMPDVEAWPRQPLMRFAEAILSEKLLFVIPADLSEDSDRIETVNALHALGALTVGRVDRQSLVVDRTPGGARAFNKQIRTIHTDVFSTVGLEPHVDARMPAVTAAGVAALVLEKWPDLTGPEVKQKIVEGARNVWQATSIETGQWVPAFAVDPVTTEYKPSDEKTIFRFRVLDAAGALGVDTEIPWFLNMLNCQKAWEITKGRGAVVVVSDQGFHIRHPGLVDHIKTTACFGPMTFESPHQNFHGTDMSRILLSVAPEAKIIPALCGGRSLEELPPNITQSFEFALEQKVDVVTASWSARFNTNEDLLAAVRRVVDAGIAVSWFHFPEPYPGVLRPSFTYAWWEEDPRLGFADRFLTDPPGFHPVEIEAGLSGTAPQAAGLAALVKSVNPTMTPAQIEKLIFENSDRIGPNLSIPDAFRIVEVARGKSRS